MFPVKELRHDLLAAFFRGLTHGMARVNFTTSPTEQN